MAGRHASFSRSSRMYPRQCAEPVDHASRAARRLNAVAISLSLSRVYAGAQSAQWHFPGWGVHGQVGSAGSTAYLRNGHLRNAEPGASLPPVSTSSNPTLCEIRTFRSVDQTNDLGLPQMPRGRGLNLCAR